MPEDTRGDKIQTALPMDSEFDGVLLAAGPVRIEGSLRGEVFGSALLEIGAAAVIEGPIEAPEIWVAGQVTGDLVASRRLELAASARVVGRISTLRLSAADGAQVDGSACVGELRKADDEPETP
ncbi:MAG: polymer-forming cytoskeletal protein [Deltaproteobacteria bacterium]|nr:polymer-forming cytoskeletal protein [Deltaproteobacteria bacterium]MBW2360756.1 polymer-forming cytoskeletal protein [Deltaproteobacteria bacterium]